MSNFKFNSNTSFDPNIMFPLTDKEAEMILDICADDNKCWEDGLLDLAMDCYFLIGERKIHYSWSGGAFSDDQNKRVLFLTDEQAGQMYEIVYKYYSDIHILDFVRLKDVVSKKEVVLSIRDHKEIFFLLEKAEWKEGSPARLYSTRYQFLFDDSIIRYSTDGAFVDPEKNEYFELAEEDKNTINAIIEKYSALNK